MTYSLTFVIKCEDVAYFICVESCPLFLPIYLFIYLSNI